MEIRLIFQRNLGLFLPLEDNDLGNPAPMVNSSSADICSGVSGVMFTLLTNICIWRIRAKGLLMRIFFSALRLVRFHRVA